MPLQFRRGTDSDRSTITPDIGEPLFTTNTKRLFIGDGTTAGGLRIGLDSSEVLDIVNDNSVDSAIVENIIDSAYVRGKQDYSYGSLTNTPTALTEFTNDLTITTDSVGEGSTNLYYTDTRVSTLVDSAYINLRTDANLDSDLTIQLIDSAYVQARQTTADLTNYRTFTQIQSMIDSEVNAVIDAAPGALDTLNELAAALNDDANFSTTITNQIAALPDSAQVATIVTSYGYATTGYVDGAVAALPDSAQVATIVTSYGYTTYDSSNTLGLIDSAYVQARQVDLQRDSGFVTGIVDSAYVLARAPAQDFLDSSEVINLIDSSYVQARQTSQDFAYSSLTGAPNVLDSANVISLITANDQQRDSAFVTDIIDSAYITARAGAGTDSATVVSIAADPVAYISETVYTVTVAAKTSAHPYYNVGSSNGYLIDGVESPFIEMVPGQTYKFDLSDTSTSAHPFRFYTDVDRTTEYTSGVTQSGTQGSANAYVSIAVDDNTPSRLYYQCSAHGNMGWAVGTHTHNLTTFDTDDLSEGSTNLYFTNTRAQGAFSAGTGITINSGTVSIGQDVNTTSNVTFNNLLLNGDLTVQGTTTTVNTETINLADNIILLNSNEANAPTENGGVEIERGTLDNVQIRWNETNDEWQLGVLDSNLDTPTYYRIFTEADSARLTSNLDATTLNGQAASYYTNYNNLTNTPTSILDFSITDGNAGQALITDGSGNFTFSTISGGGGGGASGATTTARHQNVSTGGAAYGTVGGTYSDVLVYVNGILARDSDDYSFNDSSGIVTFTTAPETGSEIDIIGIKSNTLDIDSSDNVTFNGDIKVGNHSNYSSGKTTGSSIVETTIDTFDATTVRGAKYVITAENDSDRYQISEALVIHDGTTATITTYGTINTGTGNLCVFDANYDSVSNVVELNATPTTINTVYKVVRTDVVI